MADNDMKVNPARATELIENIAHVSHRIGLANKAGRNVRRTFLTANDKTPKLTPARSASLLSRS